MKLPTSPLPFLIAVFLTTVTSTLAEAPSKLGAIGIEVADLARAQKFYTGVLGMKDSGVKYNTPVFDEIVLSHPAPNSGSSIVLMQYKTPQATPKSRIKLVFYVDNIKTTFDAVKKDGREIVMEPGTGKLGNVSIPTGFARDPDGYLLEFNSLASIPKPGAPPAKGT
ncbi:lactoylglutathione lyase [Venturia nashicola]|nr:lactoylglutathione lyase [Venturia nashicola]